MASMFDLDVETGVVSMRLRGIFRWQRLQTLYDPIMSPASASCSTVSSILFLKPNLCLVGRGDFPFFLLAQVANSEKNAL